MTESEWFQITDWRQHLPFLGDRVSPRKQRLLAAAFCRLAWHLFDDAECREAVEVAERYVEMQATVPNLESCKRRCRDLAQKAGDRYLRDANDDPAQGARYWIQRELAWAAAAVVSAQLELDKIGDRVLSVIVESQLKAQGTSLLLGSPLASRLYEEHGLRQREVLFDLIGNPFRPVVFDPAWRTSTVMALAQPMLDTGDFSALPILADALQDAGCEESDVLNHCRQEGNHFRGCWVVDGILERS